MPDTSQEVMDFIKERSKELGSMAKFARYYDIDEVHMSAWANGKRSIPEHVLNNMGWKRVSYFRRIKEDD